MNCELSIVKIVWSNLLFNKKSYKHIFKSFFNLNYYKNTIYKKDSIIALVSMGGVAVLSVISNLTVIQFIILLFVTACNIYLIQKRISHLLEQDIEIMNKIDKLDTELS